MKNLTLEQIATILGINSEKSITIEGLEYYYYNSLEASEEAIVAYYRKSIFKEEHRYSYLNALHFMDDHGFESVNELKEL